uniref:Uncharacterized protein n=1 Tax=Rhizophora mucronata TaxID=61149 RepID=A0A2P2PMH0_RHIMU
MLYLCPCRLWGSIISGKLVFALVVFCD